MCNIKIKYVTVMLLFILIANPIFAATADILTKIENDIYGFDYTKDKTQNRVSRLEKTIYGKSFSGDINKRITRLSGDISADMIGLEIPAVRDTFLAEENEPEDNSVNYPVVDEIEKMLFNTTYKNRDFHTRIVTIEKKLFGKIYDVDNYSKRMERIKAKIYPDSLTAKNYYENEYDNHNNKISNFGEFSQPKRLKMPFGQRNYTRPYTNYGDYYPNNNDIFQSKDSLNDNLTQMEYDMFGTEFSSDDAQTRIKRLNSANRARKTSHKYDSQKFSQHMSTAMEIGAMILMILAMVL